jgi:nucleoid-associated protein YgaU
VRRPPEVLGEGQRRTNLGVSAEEDGGRRTIRYCGAKAQRSCDPATRQGATVGLLSFIKDAGERLLGKGEAQTAITAAQADRNSAEKAKAANDAAADAILADVEAHNLKATGLPVTFGGATATVYGIADNQATRETIVLCRGNVHGVEAVNDQMTVDQSQPEAQYYTVVKGDTLCEISKQYYGDPNNYNAIFEANKPMLKNPDLIYPGPMTAHSGAVTIPAQW